MAPKFLERNKKKGLLAALILFLRRGKTVPLLLLIVMLASALVATPSYFLIDLPGGSRLAAAVAWAAQKAGVDTSGWGLGGKRSFSELTSAFRAAKTAGSARSIGWGTFFGRPPELGVPNSLEMVKGSRKDLEGMAGGPAGGASVKGVLTPEDAKAMRGADGVAISAGDLGGEREGFLGGVMKGLFGGGGGGAEVLGGAFAGKGFFSGRAGAGGRADDRERAALDSVGKVNVPRSSIAGGTAGRLSSMRAREINARALAGGKAAKSLGSNLSLTQLAEGKGRATLAVDECVPPACPHEFAAAQTGAIYDGNALDNVGVLSSGTDTPPSVPVDETGGAGDASQLAECSATVQQCMKDKAAPMERLGELQTQLNDLFTQMGGACSDPCSCGGCNDLKGQIHAICDGELQTVLAEIDEPCNLPSYCATLGITDPSTSAADSSVDLCKMDMQDCGCDNIMCDLGCFLGVGGS